MTCLRCARALASLILIWALLSPTPVAAQSGCVEVVGEPPHALEPCVNAERLCEGYQRTVAADGGDQRLAQVRWQVRLRARAAANAELAVDVDAFTAGHLLGRRTLSIRARDCPALPDAIALVLVLLAREAAATAPEQPPSAADGQRLTAAAKPEPRPVDVIELGAGAGVGFGALPASAFTLQLQATSRSEPVAFRARVAMLWPQQLGVEEGEVTMREYELAVEACSGPIVASSPRLALRLCAGPRVGVLHAAARNFRVQNHRADEFLMYFGVIPELSVALASSTWLQLGAGAAVALVRPQFKVGLDGGARSLSLDAAHWLRGELGLTLVQIF
jgi:hypothetical protein